MFKDHFGCVLTTVLSIVMGFIMAIAVVIVDSLEEVCRRIPAGMP
jgi:hypothetical protein